jgi:hypothetical protein
MRPIARKQLEYMQKDELIELVLQLSARLQELEEEQAKAWGRAGHERNTLTQVAEPSNAVTMLSSRKVWPPIRRIRSRSEVGANRRHPKPLKALPAGAGV